MESEFRPRLPKNEGWEELIEKIREYGFDEVNSALGIVQAKSEMKSFSIDGGIASLEELFEKFKVDPKKWDVIEKTINKYPTTMKIGDEVRQVDNFQIKARLRPKLDTATVEDLLNDIGKSYSDKGPVAKRMPASRSGLTLEIIIPDHHLGKLPATGSYSVDQASLLYMEVIDEILLRCQHPLDEIVLVTGNDYLHIDTVHSTTTKGTQMDANAAWKTLFKAGVQLQIAAIDRLKEIAPVRVIPVPGNHDFMSTISMAYLMQAWYRNDDNVTVADPHIYQYWTDGTSLVGFTHGDGVKPSQLPLIMAKEAREFHSAMVTEWHCGHLHQTRSKTMPIYPDIQEEGGVVIRTFPALCPADSYHEKHGWHLSAKKSTAILWQKGEGQIAEYSIMPKSN